MIGLYLFFVYAMCVTVLGLIVLTCVPAFRFTLANLFVFALGAFSGQFALVNLALWGISHWGIRIDYRNEGLFGYPVALVGATLGGQAWSG
jgi:hypothetical protein